MPETVFFVTKNMHTTTTGQRGEKIAQKYLLQKGFRILNLNVSNTHGKRLGEIDIVAKQGSCIVFIEVKTRIKKSFIEPFPEENITRSKLSKCVCAAEMYLKNKRLENMQWRFDALSIVLCEQQKVAKIKHMENIFF